MTPPPEPGARRDLSGAERVLHALFALLLILVAIGSLALAVGWFLAARTPSWWEAPALADPKLPARAESVERFVSNEVSRPREPDTPWRMAVPEDAATAWANERLPRWLANREIEWPLDGAPLLVLFREGSVVLATDLASPGERPRVVGAHLALTARNQRLSARLTGVSIGSLTLPARLAASTVRGALPEDADPEALEALDGLLRGRPLHREAAWRVDDARIVRLLDVRLEDGRAILTCVTERAR